MRSLLLLIMLLAASPALAQDGMGDMPGMDMAPTGVLGAYLLRFPTNRVRAIVPIGCFPLVVSVPALAVIGLWAATQFLHGFATIGPHALGETRIAYFAHIGGFLSGVFLIGFFATPTSRGRRRSRCA